MRWMALVAVALTFVGGASNAPAQDQVVLKGRITCAKCELGETKKCATVIVVPEGGQQVVYYFDPQSHSKYHRDTCGGSGRNGSVTGQVAVNKDGVKFIFVSQLRYEP